eukprot:g3279.t1
MDDLPAEGDFDDVAAAVGEGGDGSDDDARSDDFLSWLLVHADTIDPKLDDLFDNDEIAADGGLSSSSPPPAGAAAAAAGSAADTAGAAGVSVGASTAAAANAPADPVLLTAPPARAPPGAGMDGVPPTPHGGSNGKDAATLAASAASSADVGGARAAGDEVAPAVGDPRTGVGLPASSLVPSDPVLAMQMGARLALTGHLNLIPFGDINTATAGSEAPPPELQAQPTAPPAAPTAVARVASGAAAAAAAAAAALPNNPPVFSEVAAAAASTPAAPAAPPGVLPEWTGLPHPPLWLKPDDQPLGLASESGTPQPPTDNAPLASDGVGAGEAAGAGAASAGVGGGWGTWSGVGEKRPSGKSAAAAAEGGKVARAVSKDGRKRKKMTLGELEERVKQVSEDNGRLKLHLSNVNEKLLQMANKKKLMEAEIASKLEAQRASPGDANQASLAEALSRFKDLYADYGKHRKKEVEFHLKQLERQIVPTDTTKMSLWTLEQDESFYKDRKRGSLSNILRTELGVSEEQIERIQERRARIKSLLNDLGESLRLLRDLHKSSEAKNAKFEEVMARLQSAFSPQQIARLLLWVSANRAHISKLPLLPKQMLQQQQQQQQQLEQEQEQEQQQQYHG